MIKLIRFWLATLLAPDGVTIQLETPNYKIVDLGKDEYSYANF